jgi:hypothetical protein
MAWEMNETDARAWLRSGIEWIREGLTLTTTTVDDSVADMVLNSLADRWGDRGSRSPENRPSAGADVAN